MKLYEHAVYTTILPKTIFEASRGADPSKMVSEKKPWVTALHRFESARKKGLAFPVLFSDARRCSDLVFWATIVDMKVWDGRTSIRFADLKGLRDCFTQDLVLSSKKRNIAPQFIRPYALVMTPSFLEDASVDAAQRFDEHQSQFVEIDWDRRELVKEFSLDRSDKGWYFLDVDGDVSRRPLIRRRGQVSEKVVKLGIQREPGFYYDLHEDDEGKLGVFRASIIANEQDAK